MGKKKNRKEKRKLSNKYDLIDRFTKNNALILIFAFVVSSWNFIEEIMFLLIFNLTFSFIVSDNTF